MLVKSAFHPIIEVFIELVVLVLISVFLSLPIIDVVQVSLVHVVLLILLHLFDELCIVYRVLQIISVCFHLGSLCCRIVILLEPGSLFLLLRKCYLLVSFLLLLSLVVEHVLLVGIG